MIGENFDTYSSVYDSRVLVVEEIEKETSGSVATKANEIASVNYPSVSTISVADLYALVNDNHMSVGRFLMTPF